MSDKNEPEFTLSASYRALLVIVCVFLLIAGFANIDQLIAVFGGKP